MRLLDDTIHTRKSSHTVKPWWEVCCYCHQPFTTDTFDKTCQRCKHFEKFKDEYASKVMIKFILSVTFITVVSAIIGPYLYKYTQNPYHFAGFLCILNVIIGISLWRAVKKLSK